MPLEIKKYRIVIELTEDLLGTTPKQKEVYKGYITSLKREELAKVAARNQAEAEKAEEETPVETNARGKGRKAKEKVPPREPERLASGENVTPGSAETVLVEEEETLQEVEEKGWTGFHTDREGPFLFDYMIRGFLTEAARTLKESGAVKQLQDKFKRYCFVKPRRIRLPPVEGHLERPLRAQTAQGPRVALARSDVVKAGSQLTFEIHILKGGSITRAILKDVLEYGQYQGLGQWRTGGHGRFIVVSLEEID